MKKESFEEVVERFNKDERIFVCTEALRIFTETDDESVALEALRLLEKAAQPY